MFRQACETELLTASNPADMARPARDAVADGVDFLGVLGGDGLSCPWPRALRVLVPGGLD